MTWQFSADQLIKSTLGSVDPNNPQATAVGVDTLRTALRSGGDSEDAEQNKDKENNEGDLVDNSGSSTSDAVVNFVASILGF
jgi:hypothetical protein